MKKTEGNKLSSSFVAKILHNAVIVVGGRKSYFINKHDGVGCYWGPKKEDAYEFDTAEEARTSGRLSLPSHMRDNVVSEPAK
ncbi:MAG: hypothetical protein PF572_03980 [Patescibacteria group bacterium]|nr:hypothetical protein [Patescibacteria group bacterium]